ncbi:MAG: hypothetical protein AAGD08_22335 [Pseudomonadota bacterium]
MAKDTEAAAAEALALAVDLDELSGQIADDRLRRRKPYLATCYAQACLPVEKLRAPIGFRLTTPPK